MDQDAWNNNQDVWPGVGRAHPIVKVFLRLIALVATGYTFFLFYRQYASETYLNLRCSLIRFKEDDCDGVGSPRITQIMDMAVFTMLYVIFPMFSMIGQMHHLHLWICPKLIFYLPERIPWHKFMLITLGDATFRMTLICSAEMTVTGTINPISPSENDLFPYITASLLAIWNFGLFAHFFVYSHMTDGEEELAYQFAQM